MINKEMFYPLSDMLSIEERKRFDITFNESFGGRIMRAKWDGQPKRSPKKGEWFLSGAVIGAYKAPNDLTQEYHIANIVKTKTTTVTTVVEI